MGGPLWPTLFEREFLLRRRGGHGGPPIHALSFLAMAAEVSAINRRCETRWLGRVTYDHGLRLQQSAIEGICSNESSEQLLLLEHPHVFTLGRGADAANILADEEQLKINSVEVHETGRGGDVTYHGPGQLVGYPIINLKPDRCDVHRYVRDLEEVLIRTIAEFGVTGTRISGLTGVWVGNEKIAAIGVRIARWITSHGFALNVNTDLDYFKMIVPCGITDRGVTSLSSLLGKEIPLQEVAHIASSQFATVFGRKVGFSNLTAFSPAVRP
jgi:lipoyl(octanoyl) transferase